MNKEQFNKKWLEEIAKQHKLADYQVKLLEMHMKQQVSPYTIMGRRLGRTR